MPDVREQYASAGMEVRSSAPRRLRQIHRAGTQKMRTLAANGGIKPE